jgi:hypothetical protein
MKLNGEFAYEPQEKAQLLTQSLFPAPARADLSDIEGYQYPPAIECPDITESGIEKAILGASPNKAPGGDGIANGILQ